MILVRNKGQMCNNIIQFAHAYAWAREHGMTAVSMRFAYKYRYFHICDTPHHNLFFYLLGKWSAKLGVVPVVSYDNITADDARANERKLLERAPLVVLEGWSIRHHDLVDKYLGEIAALFQFRDSAVAQVRQRMNGTLSDGGALIGVHIRRGDYTTFMDGRFNYSDDCYIGHIRQTLGLLNGQTATVIVCTNDRSLDIDRFRAALPSANVVLADGNAVEDLYTLSQCHYLLGAPSSFSLVATLYGKARLYWIRGEKGEALADSSFQGFSAMSRTFDYSFSPGWQLR